MTINNREVDRNSLEFNGVSAYDYPDFSDVYIIYAEFTDGTELSQEDLDQLNEERESWDEILREQIGV